jgi:hypothetical protein
MKTLCTPHWYDGSWCPEGPFSTCGRSDVRDSFQHVFISVATALNSHQLRKTASGHLTGQQAKQTMLGGLYCTRCQLGSSHDRRIAMTLERVGIDDCTVAD